MAGGDNQNNQNHTVKSSALGSSSRSRDNVTLISDPRRTQLTALHTGSRDSSGNDVDSWCNGLMTSSNLSSNRSIPQNTSLSKTDLHANGNNNSNFPHHIPGSGDLTSDPVEALTCDPGEGLSCDPREALTSDSRQYNKSSGSQGHSMNSQRGKINIAFISSNDEPSIDM